MIIWEIKDTATSSYYKMPSPSSYSIDAEDLEADSYSAITTGNLIRNVVSQNWSKLAFSYNLLTPNAAITILEVLNRDPILVRAQDPVLGTLEIEMEMFCSSKKLDKLETGDYTLSFSLIQKTKVSGQ